MSFAWFLASPGQVHACKCAVPATPAEELEKFSAVFTGRVVSVRHSYDLNAASYTPDDRTTVGFEVSTVWKGTVHEDMLITTPPTGGSCGFTFAEGEEYVVYADDSAYGDDGYTVGICSRTALLRQAQADLDALGEGRAPQAGTGGPAPRTTTGFRCRLGVDHHPGRCCDGPSSGRDGGVPKSEASVDNASRSPRSLSSSSASTDQRASPWRTWPTLQP